ncbi:MAG: hypothetical protein D6791_18050 [Chloroflexi bacterium]|nr:MAG: hypothetical protein D6791_18050 [Chloroflexota bacterium]
MPDGSSSRKTKAPPLRRVDEIGYGPQLFIHHCFPYKKPSVDKLINGCWIRSNGQRTLIMQPAPSMGVPYGSYPRLLTIYIASRAIRENSRHLVLGRSISEFAKILGIPRTCGAHTGLTKLRTQLRALLSTRFILQEYRNLSADDSVVLQEDQRFIQFSDAATLLWMREIPNRKQRGGSWKLEAVEIELSETIFEEFRKHCIPVQQDAIQALRSSPLALDIYQWLAHRFYRLTRPLLIPWDQLARQFGTSTVVHSFRQSFIKALARVLEVYPEAQCQPENLGLKLYPSPTPVSTSRFYV